MSTQKKFYRREDIIGKKIVNQDALEEGSAKDTAFDVEGKLHLIVTRKDSEEEEYVSIDDIKAFGDYILLKGVAVTGGAVAQDASLIAVNKICSKCGNVNNPNVGFCTKCGTRLV